MSSNATCADLALSVRGLSKSFTIEHQDQKHVTLAETLLDRVRRPFQRNARETFWALQDVSFDVRQGDVVGIIGRNGAGKSTLLKILSRITEPTAGVIDLYGRVGSLLEVGTGFHPELTGRENIYLNGAILGMSHAEITRHFDAIVSFAEVDKFLDTPVKRYSSGMYVRLAFAVAAHLEPEILIVDEVLAVGDTAFQKKCLGKMQEVGQSGRTVLFVSHNMVATNALCNRAILLDRGQVVMDGPTADVTAHYQKLCAGSQATLPAESWVRRHTGRSLRVAGVDLLVNGQPSPVVRSGDRCELVVGYETMHEAPTRASFSILVHLDGRKVANLWTEYERADVSPGTRGEVRCEIPRWPFRSGSVLIDVYTHTGLEVQDWVEGVLQFDSSDGDFYRSGVITNPDQGIVFVEHHWSHHAA